MLLNVLFARRVRFHKAVGINDLDEWPALKVNNSFDFGSEYSLLTHNRKVWFERISARPTVEVGVNVGKY